MVDDLRRSAEKVGERATAARDAAVEKAGAARDAAAGTAESAKEAAGDAIAAVRALAPRVPWIEARPGVRQKRIWEDKAGERRAILARFEPGATLPPHRHVGDELIFLVEGANADESGIVATGNMNYRPNGCVHSVTTKNGATVLAVVWGRTEPI